MVLWLHTHSTHSTECKTEDAAREMYSQSDLCWVASLFARDPIPPPRGHRLALDSVSFVVDTIRAGMNEKNLQLPCVVSVIRRRHQHQLNTMQVI